MKEKIEEEEEYIDRLEIYMLEIEEDKEDICKMESCLPPGPKWKCCNGTHQMFHVFHLKAKMKELLSGWGRNFQILPSPSGNPKAKRKKNAKTRKQKVQTRRRE